MLVAGRVGRPHGLDGSFHVLDGRPRLLCEGAEVGVGDTRRRVERRAGTDARPIVRLAGVGDRGSAEALRGAELTVGEAQAPPLEEGEWWAEELEGCVVRDGPRRVGVVARLVALPSCEALAVRRDGESELLVPMVGAAIRSVDVEQGEIDVDLAFLGEEPAA